VCRYSKLGVSDWAKERQRTMGRPLQREEDEPRWADMKKKPDVDVKKKPDVHMKKKII